MRSGAQHDHELIIALSIIKGTYLENPEQLFNCKYGNWEIVGLRNKNIIITKLALISWEFCLDFWNFIS